MTQILAPELYLSLLSGRSGGVSHISTGSDIRSRLSAYQFPNDPNRLMNLLDAFASICVRKEGEVFFVSLAMESGSATLYVTSNDTVPLSLTTYLYKIRGQLKNLNAILEFNSPTPTDSKLSPNANNTESDAVVASELELKKTIYEHSYSKLRRRFLKRAPAILAKYPFIKTSFRVNGIATEDTDLLDDTIPLLRWLEQRLENKRPPSGKEFVDFILRRFKEKADIEGVDAKKGITPQLSMNAKVHAECTLLAYHLQHPETNPYHYFGGSKLPCHGCATFFKSFNLVAESFHYPQIFTKGCHHKIYLQWPCPFLLSQEQQGEEPTLDAQVREGMVAILSTELAAYVNKLRADAEPPDQYPFQSNMDMKALLAHLAPEIQKMKDELSGKFRCLVCPWNSNRLFVFRGVEDHLRVKHNTLFAQDGVHYAPAWID